MRCFIVCLILVLVAVLAQAAQLPKEFKRCQLKDPNIKSCLREAVEGAIQFLRNGAVELGVKPFEPLEISQLVIGEGKGPVNVQQNFKNVDLHGLTGSKVLYAEPRMENNMLIARSMTPELRLEADYSMRGRVLLLPIYGDGRCNVTLINTSINHTLHGETYKKRGKTFMRFARYDVTLRPERMVYKFDNLFDGNEQLGREINNVLNDNWNEVFTDVRDGYEKSFGLIFQDLANRVFSKVALKDIFSDYEDKP